MDKTEKNLLHDFDKKALTSKSNWPIVGAVIIGSILLGVVTGYGIKTFAPQMLGSKETTKGSEETSSDAQQSAGILDKETFKDKAEGVLKEGGIEGEGSFHIEQKPNQPDQNAYLTSSTVDLSLFVDKKVRVWGQTFSAEKAGWLMDVGYIEVIK